MPEELQAHRVALQTSARPGARDDGADVCRERGHRRRQPGVPGRVPAGEAQVFALGVREDLDVSAVAPRAERVVLPGGAENSRNGRG